MLKKGKSYNENNFFFSIIFFLQNSGYASNKDNIVKKLNSINNLSFNLFKLLVIKTKKVNVLFSILKKIFVNIQKK